MVSDSDNKPTCYGILDRVFPLGGDDLRSVRPSCRECEIVKKCLAAAAGSPAGIEMRAARMEAATPAGGSGLAGFLARWSELKMMRRGRAPKVRGEGGKK